MNGIALGPGYVISYTVGRLQLETLLAEYRLRTGENGSLRDFHDRLLSYGTDAVLDRRARAAGRSRQAGERSARGGELLSGVGGDRDHLPRWWRGASRRFARAERVMVMTR